MAVVKGEVVTGQDARRPRQGLTTGHALCKTEKELMALFDVDRMWVLYHSMLGHSYQRWNAYFGANQNVRAITVVLNVKSLKC